MSIRLFPAGGSAVGRAGAFGSNPFSVRTYTATAGEFVDVPGDATGDADTLTSQGFFAVGNGSGTTAQRPNFPANQSPLQGVGYVYIDTTINKVVVFDGANWRDPVTGDTA